MGDAPGDVESQKKNDAKTHIVATSVVGLLFVVCIIVLGILINAKDSPLKGDDDEHWDKGTIKAFDSDLSKIADLTATKATLGEGHVTTLSATGHSEIADAHIAKADIDGGAIDATAVGAETASTGAFTTVSATGKATLADAVITKGHIATANIDGGAIDATTVGATTASTGAFTTLTATESTLANADITKLTTTGRSTIADADINGGAIDGTAIGATTPSTAKFTTLHVSGKATLDDLEALPTATIGDLKVGSITNGGVRPVYANYQIKSSDSYVIALKAVTLTLPKANLAAGMLLTVINGAIGANKGAVTLQIKDGAVASTVYGTKKVGTTGLTGSCMAGNFIGLDSTGCSKATATDNYGTAAHYDISNDDMYVHADAGNVLADATKYCCYDAVGDESVGSFTTSSAPNDATPIAGQGGFVGDATGVADGSTVSLTLTSGDYTADSTKGLTGSTDNTNSGGNHAHAAGSLTLATVSRSAIGKTVGSSVTIISDGANWHVVSTGARDTFGVA